MMPYESLIGRQFGRWLVLDEAERPVEGRGPYWLCRCACGVERVLVGSNLRNGHSTSCGCAKKSARPNYRHGGTYTKAYGVWLSMRRRCHDPNSKSYPDYGARGITVCDRWSAFENFLADMGQPPPGLTLERKDNGKGYSPENCVWASRADQRRNTRHTDLITIDGVTKCRKDWLAANGLTSSTFRRRIERGWTREEAVSVPRGSERVRAVLGEVA